VSGFNARILTPLHVFMSSFDCEAAAFSLTPFDFFLRLFVNRLVETNTLNLIVCAGSENFESTIRSHLLELKFLSTLMLYSAAAEKRALVIACELL
jgi:hypothetical protein